MNCEEISTVIPRYMAGESDAAEAVAIEEHLASCRQCAAELVRTASFPLGKSPPRKAGRCKTVVNVLQGLVPALTLFSSFIYAFACLTVAVLFYVFHRARS
jgi:hypothetical protein